MPTCMSNHPLHTFFLYSLIHFLDPPPPRNHHNNDAHRCHHVSLCCRRGPALQTSESLFLPRPPSPSAQMPSSRFCPPRRRHQLCHDRLYRLATGMIAHCPVGPSGTRDQIDPPPRQEEQTPPLCCVPCTGDERSIVIVDAVVGQRFGEAVPPLPHPFQGVRERGPRQDPPSSSSLPSWMMRSWAPPASLH
jgi:hypothetical protein